MCCVQPFKVEHSKIFKHKDQHFPQMSLLKRCKYIFFNSSINCLTSFSVSSLRHHSQKRPAHMKCLVESAAEHVRNNPAERAFMTWHCYSSWDSLKDYWNGSCMSHVGKTQDTVSVSKSNLSYPKTHWNEVTDSSGVILDFHPYIWCSPEEQPAQGDKHQPPCDK